MTTLGRLGIYLITFIIVVTVLVFVTDFWKSIDYFVYKTFYLDKSESIDLRSDIVLIDLPYEAQGASAFDRENYRNRLSDLLDTIGSRYDSNHRPRAVILDIFFTSDPQGLDTLKQVLKRLNDRNLKVYGVYDMRNYEQTYFEKRDAKQARELYENYFEGYRLHTLFEERMGVLSYSSILEFERESGDYELVESLASKVARDLNANNTFPDEFRDYILPLGNEQSIENQTYQFIHPANQTAGGSFSSEFDLTDKIIIIGSLAEDQLVGINKTGTHLVAWALYDQLEKNLLAKQPLNNIAVILAMVLFFAFFVVIIFSFIFKYIKRLQTKPLIIAIISFIAGAALLLGFGYVILVTDYVIPLGLTLIGMLVAALLAWRFSAKFLVTGIVEGGEIYDVFISYSHGNYDWVKNNIYLPLSEFKKKDGSKLNIFFDEKSIGIGEQFTIKYMKGIVDSKIFIPIISEEYYGKNHCKNEMNLAIKRHVEQLIMLKPIAFNFDCVPEVFRHIIFVDVSQNADFMKTFQEDLSESLA